MTAETRRDVGRLLADQLDHIAPDLALMEAPYRRAAELEAQRDEYCRRVQVAEAYIGDMPCRCGDVFPCDKHQLLAILCGDL